MTPGAVGARVGLIPVEFHRELATFALCDRDDFELLMRSRWRLTRNGYAIGYVDGREISMHRLLLGLSAGDGRQGDHRNRCRLDNRRCNLRIVTRAENAQNHPGFGGTSDFRGVHRRKDNGRFSAKVRLHGRLHDVGSFGTEMEAARAAEIFRLEHMAGARPELDVPADDSKAAAA
jgi:hypothetical protein